MIPSHLPGRPPDTDGGAPRDIEVRYYAELLWRRRILLTAAAIGGLALGVLAGELQVPRFQARTLLQVMPPTPTSLNVTDALVQTGNPVRDRQFFNTQLNVLHSRAIAERVVDKLKLKDQPAFAAAPDAVGFFLTTVAVEPIPETYVVEVRITNNDPKDAALWANTLADIYMDYSIEGQVEAAKRAYKWVNERLAETQTGMQQAQDKLLKSYQGQDLFVPEGSVSAITTSITKLTEDHIQAQARRIELEAQLGEFQEARRRGRGTGAIPQVGGDQSVAEINGKIQSLNVDLARLREKYKEGHPEVQKIQVQIQQLRKDKDARVAQIEESFRAEYRQLQRKESELKAAIDDHKGRAADQSLKMTELESLKKQADSAAGLYTVLLQKLNETNIAASIQNNNVRLLDRAVVPSTPVWPRKRQVALVGLLGGLLLGAGFVLLRDALDNTLKDADDVERHLHLELLAAIPRYGKDDATLATEAYQNLRTALLFSRRGDEGQVVLVTGTAPGEGKTTTLLNVAKLLAVSGESVVVVDCDLRRANLHLRLNVPREPGFTDFFVKGQDMGALVRTTRVQNLSVIPAGPLPPNPPALLARPELATALLALKRQYRWVLVDSPPVAAVTDALLLAQRADSTLLVVQQNKVDRAMVKRALAALRKVTPHVIGAVLNAVDVKTKGYYGYAYYGSRKDPKDRRAASRSPQGRRLQPHAAVPEPEVTDASLV
ncbi:MAG TPA: polysaccharide biosynthesis tyrosine autokinase [Vicinamibacteria bacterium]|nr:polysaccharide biosynthesis tyrosine autokinase [Vicinamibacteria bacterium]